MKATQYLKLPIMNFLELVCNMDKTVKISINLNIDICWQRKCMENDGNDVEK